MENAGVFAVNLSISASPPLNDPENLKASIVERVRPDIERIELELDRQYGTNVPMVTVVSRYIVSSGGKRLRPLLMVLAARLCGYDEGRDAPLAAVFEYLHAASLLHDDVVDGAEIRRNRPAANTQFGNPAVVLVGDYLYSRAIRIAVSYNNVRILEVLMDATSRMSEGEVLQLSHSDNLELTEKEYLDVIMRKTAVLISAACQIGAILGGASPAREKALMEYGLYLGMAFQLIDDTLDYTGDVQELGKPVGNDIEEGKATLPLIASLRNGSPEEAERLRSVFVSECIAREDHHEVRALVQRLGGIEYTVDMAADYVARAKASLGGFPDHPTKDLLLDFADYVICRRV